MVLFLFLFFDLHVPFTQFHPMVTSYKPIPLYHRQDIDTDSVEIEDISISTRNLGGGILLWPQPLPSGPVSSLTPRQSLNCSPFQ